MNQEKHWNTIAGTYNDEVFDVFKENKGKKLQKFISKHVSKRKAVIDLGCGIGKAFRYLAPASKSVLAIDISQACLNEAQQNSYTNIVYKQADLTLPFRFKPADFVLCCNVAILHSSEQSYKIINTIGKALKQGGTGIVVVPSLESSLYSAWQMVQWYKAERVSPGQIPAEELAYFNGPKTNLLQGIVTINGVKTKHYLAEELHVVFEQAGLKITELEKLEYDWSTEFTTPPKWLTQPYPWDWMVECRKR